MSREFAAASSPRNTRRTIYKKRRLSRESTSARGGDSREAARITALSNHTMEYSKGKIAPASSSFSLCLPICAESPRRRLQHKPPGGRKSRNERALEIEFVDI